MTTKHHMVKTIRVLVVDDVAASRETLRRALAFDPGIEVVGEAGTGQEAVARTEELAPDLILMDVRMPGGNGVEATRTITQRFPRSRVVALTAHDDTETVREMIAAGAVGYYLKGASVDDLLAAVHSAHGGEEKIDPKVLPNAIDELRRLLREERNRREEIERLALLRQEFIQVLSHELRTPLTVMAGALRFMERRELGPDERSLIASALSRSEELERMVEGLELIGEVPPAEGAVADPADAVRDAVTRLGERPDRIHLTGGAWPGVRPPHLSRIVYELLSNAFKHGRHPVSLSAVRRRDAAVLEVGDAGTFRAGPEAFEAFAAGDMSATREKGGLGLGLFVTHRLCEADGGRLTFHRERDRTVARVRYPLAD